MAQIIGVFRIGRDAEVRYSQGNNAVSSLSLAFNYGQKGQDGTKPSQWIDASLWGKRAEAMAPFLKKGSLIYCVINDPHIETYQGKNGEGHKLVGTVSEIEFAGGRSAGGESSQNSAESRPAPSPSAAASSAPAKRDPFQMDDDIPF